MTATKSRLGHAEPAAGAVGIANLITMLGQATTHAISNLRQVRYFDTFIQCSQKQLLLVPRKHFEISVKQMQNADSEPVMESSTCNFFVFLFV